MSPGAPPVVTGSAFPPPSKVSTGAGPYVSSLRDFRSLSFPMDAPELPTSLSCSTSSTRSTDESLPCLLVPWVVREEKGRVDRSLLSLPYFRPSHFSLLPALPFSFFVVQATSSPCHGRPRRDDLLPGKETRLLRGTRSSGVSRVWGSHRGVEERTKRTRVETTTDVPRGK